MGTIIETERLILREITLDDAEEMYKLHAHPEVQKYTGEPVVKSIDEIKDAIETRKIDYKKYGYGRWATILKSENKFVGWAGLAYLPEFDEVDIGYRFLPEYWGMGIATEVSQEILNYGFEVIKLKKIIAIALQENKASIRVMEKIGMQFDKIAPYDEEITDAVWYRCEKDVVSKNI